MLYAVAARPWFHDYRNHRHEVSLFGGTVEPSPRLPIGPVAGVPAMTMAPKDAMAPEDGNASPRGKSAAKKRARAK